MDYVKVAIFWGHMVMVTAHWTIVRRCCPVGHPITDLFKSPCKFLLWDNETYREEDKY